MARELATGIFADDGVELGMARIGVVEGRRWRCITAHPTTARALLGNGTAQRLLDMYADAEEGTYWVPDAFLHPPAERVEDDQHIWFDWDEYENLKAGLRIAERGFSEICAHPPCILTATRRNDDYSLCSHHDDILLAAARDGASMRGLSAHRVQVVVDEAMPSDVALLFAHHWGQQPIALDPDPLDDWIYTPRPLTPDLPSIGERLTLKFREAGSKFALIRRL